MSLNRKSFGSALVLAAALAACAGAARAEDRALLVGVEHYRVADVPPTPGCVKDALETAELLKRRLNFPAGSVRVLLNADATSENILRQFREWLIEGSRPGDRVFFMYSGHGSKLPVIDDRNEPDNKDETIAPYDVDPRTGANEIRDDVFERLISQLSGRRAVLLFDSCHSGTISRGLPPLGQYPQGGGARYLPPPEEFNRLAAEGATRGGGPAPYVILPETGARALSIERYVSGAKVGDLSGVVVISAAGANQLAYPLMVGAEARGALSYVFAETLDAGSPSLSALKARLLQRIDELHRSKKLFGDQRPEVEVISTVPLDDQPLFGSWEQAPAVALANPLSRVKVSVGTGEGKSTYRVGETVSFRVSTSAPGYLYLLIFSRENVATCVIPSEQDRDNYLEAGTYTFPRGSYTFPIQPPTGRDVVVALLSKKQLNLGERVNYTWDEVFARLNLRLLQEAVGSAAMRGVGVKATTLGADDWQSATFVLESRP